MAEHFDGLETRPHSEREKALFAALPVLLDAGRAKLPGLAGQLGDVEASSLTDREALAGIPVLRKSELMQRQAADPPFGGFFDHGALAGRHIFVSPGPICEPEGGPDRDREAARAFFAAGIRPGDLVHNAFSYHMTPGAFMLDAGARALGCTVFPGGTGNTQAQAEAAARLRPAALCGTPDFLKLLLDKAEDLGLDLSSLQRGLVSGGALFPSLREDYRARGIAVLQCYATAEFGVIAYESADETGRPHEGMVLAENLIVEIVRPGTGDPVPDGEVGEVVVTSLDPAYPLLRLGTGDLSAILPGASPCGRTGARIRGWLGRADQRTKVKGMFVDPRQIAEILTRHAGIARARLVVARAGDGDAMVLHVEADGATPETGAIEKTLHEVTGLGGRVELAAPGSLPNDGKVIADERDYSA